jgi:hypothetical protein
LDIGYHHSLPGKEGRRGKLRLSNIEHLVEHLDASYVEGHPNLKIPSDLTTAGCLLFSLPEFRTPWVFRSPSAEFVVPVSGHLVTSNALALRSAALDGLGPA